VRNGKRPKEQGAIVSLGQTRPMPMVKSTYGSSYHRNKTYGLIEIFRNVQSMKIVSNFF
jgi:hypothetical protein